MSTLKESAKSRSTEYELFEAVCAAAGIAGLDRVGVFLGLPELLQERIWIELAAQVQDGTGS